MYAIIEDSGQQFRVQEGDQILVDLRPAEKGATLTFDRVVLIGGGEKTLVGKPHLSGATVTAEVLGQMKGVKIEVFKFTKRTNYKRHIGHRQKYLSVRINQILAGQ